MKRNQRRHRTVVRSRATLDYGARTGAVQLLAAGYVAVTTVTLCGGSPRTPRRWSETGRSYWVESRHVSPGGDVRSGWDEMTHYVGRCPCRMATPEEELRAELGDVYRGRVGSAGPQWCGHPAVDVLAAR
jgi:hypothetical protein